MIPRMMQALLVACLSLSHSRVTSNDKLAYPVLSVPLVCAVKQQGSFSAILAFILVESCSNEVLVVMGSRSYPQGFHPLSTISGGERIPHLRIYLFILCRKLSF